VLQGHAGPVECIDFTPDGSKLVSAGADGTVRIWNAPTCTLSQEWRAHDGNIESLDISPDGNAIVTGSFDGTVRAWSTQDGTLHWTWGPTWLVRGVAFSPDGRQVAVVETHGAVALLDAHAGALLQMLARHAGTGRGVCFAPSGQWLATCADDQMLQMFSAANGESWGRFLAHDHKFWSVAASPDSRRLVTTSSDQTAKVWEMPARYPTRVIRETRGSLPNVAFALDGTALAVGFTSGGIDRHQIAVFDQLGRRSIQADDDLLTSHIAWTSSQDLCYARKDGSLVLWDRRTGASRVLRGPLDPPAEGWHPGGAVIALAYTHLTRTLCAAYSDGTLRFCDLERSNDQVIGRNSHRWIRRIAPSGDQTIAIARENSVRFWDARLKEWMPDTVAIPEPNRLAALAVARDGQRLAVGLTSGGILLVDRRTSQTQARLYGHQASIDCLAFSPDGKTLASGSADGTVRFWHVPTAQELFVLHDRQMSGGIYSLGFSPDGACLAMGGAPLRDGNSVVLYGDPAPEIRD
jgi:WD40 repeat protein